MPEKHTKLARDLEIGDSVEVLQRVFTIGDIRKKGASGGKRVMLWTDGDPCEYVHTLRGSDRVKLALKP